MNVFLYFSSVYFKVNLLLRNILHVSVKNFIESYIMTLSYTVAVGIPQTMYHLQYMMKATTWLMLMALLLVILAKHIQPHFNLVLAPTIAYCSFFNIGPIILRPDIYKTNTTYTSNVDTSLLCPGLLQTFPKVHAGLVSNLIET